MRILKRFGPLLTVAALAIVIGLLFAGPVHFYVKLLPLYFQQPDARISMPLAEVTKTQIADTWHAARGTDRVHEGQDIFAAKGTPVYSATRGYVLKIGENTLGGQTVSVIGAGGRVYYYAHLNSYAAQLAVGDYVTPQTVLGYVGTTGNAQGTPPHLHFGIYTTTGAINPLPLLTDRSSTASKRDKSNSTKHPLVSPKVIG